MNELNAVIITIGDELLIGQTVDTNSAFIAQQLNKAGIWIKRRIAIGDDREEILRALSEQSRDNHIIILTGGLGPTADDITKPALCEYFGSSLVQDENVLAHVKAIFARLNRPLLERNIKQAEVPHNCTVLPNSRGTAPGMWFEKEGVIYISLPGVPYEMMGLMEERVIPKLKEQFAPPAILHKTALTMGAGESTIAEELTDFEKSLPPYIKLAYLPAYGLVRLRLTAKGKDIKKLEEETEKYFTHLRRKVNTWLVAEEDITLVDVLGRLLDQKKKFVGTAESCTGGYIAHLLTSRTGASSSFKGGIVSYANQAKENLLGVQHQTLVKHGAVSEETVTEMARGVQQAMQVDYAVATSGIMGPDGGTKEKPVGTVWIAVADTETTKAQKYFVRFDRKRNIEQAAQLALHMLVLFIKEQEKD